jgi:hypothetical protein
MAMMMCESVVCGPAFSVEDVAKDRLKAELRIQSGC